MPLGPLVIAVELDRELDQLLEGEIVGGGPAGDGLLLEDGSYLLQETGDFILLE